MINLSNALNLGFLKTLAQSQNQNNVEQKSTRNTSTDSDAFSKLMSQKSDRSSFDFSSGRSQDGDMRSILNEMDQLNLDMMQVSRDASKRSIEASRNAIEQRINNQEEAMLAESAGGAVKKATEVVDKIKF